MVEKDQREWTTANIEDIAAPDTRAIAIGPFGSALKAEVYAAAGVPVIRGQDIQQGRRIADEDLAFVPPEVTTKFPGCIVRKGDIVFPHRGAIGRAGIIDEREFMLSSSMMKLTCNKKLVDPTYIFYYFRGPGRAELLSRGSTVGTPGIGQPLRSLRGIPIHFPSLNQQRAIAEVLGALDDKIAANDRACQLSSRLARAVFSRAAVEGPRTTIQEIAQLVSRGVTPKYTDSDGIVVLNQKCIRGQRINLGPARRTAPLRTRLDRLLQRHDVLVNSTGQGTLGRAARWLHDIRATADSHISIVRFDPGLVDPVCAGFSILHIEEQIEGLAEGSTGQTELKRDLLSGVEITVPPRPRQASVGVKLTSLDELIIGLSHESDELAQTRDELLPLLMSGKVRVRDAERTVEEVV